MAGPIIIPMESRTTEIEGLRIITLKQITDDRGTVREFFRASTFGDDQVGAFQQMNVTETKFGAIRGLHGEDMVKLVGIVAGEGFGAYLDAREGSPTYGNTVTVSLTPGTQVIVPKGVCNGFQVTSQQGAQYMYAFDAEWVPGMAGVAFNPFSPDLAIEWPVDIDRADTSLLSGKDAAAPEFSRSN